MPAAHEQPACDSILTTEGVEAPVHRSDGVRRTHAGESPFCHRSELGAVPGRESEVVPSHQSRGNGPAPQELLHISGRIPGRAFDVRRDGDRSARTGVHLPEAREAARKGESPYRSMAVSVAPRCPWTQGDPNGARNRTGPRHRASAGGTDRSQSLANRSLQARAVRLTSSEKPVRMCWTVPSSHSRKTCGIR